MREVSSKSDLVTLKAAVVDVLNRHLSLKGMSTSDAIQKVNGTSDFIELGRFVNNLIDNFGVVGSNRVDLIRVLHAMQGSN